MINMRTMPRYQTQLKPLLQVLAGLLLVAGAAAAVLIISIWNQSWESRLKLRK